MTTSKKISQETSTTAFRPLLLGRGKLARHLQQYFTQKNIPFLSYDHARTLDADFFNLVQEADSIWILVSDRAIAEVHEKILVGLKNQTQKPVFVHCSAALSIPGMITLHPLMTFGPSLYPDEEYEQIPFTYFLEEVGENRTWLEHALSHLPNPRQVLSKADRVLYHAFCVMTSNFPQILWEATFQGAEKIGAERASFEPILKRSVINYLIYGKSALTGPLVRGDASTVQKHLTVLENTPYHALYQAFVDLYQQQQIGDPTHDHGTRI